MLPAILKTPGTVRASFYFYNTKEEIDVLVEALKTVTLENCIGIFF
jgi:cysteine desulfurase/selenocysteine lyase